LEILPPKKIPVTKVEPELGVLYDQEGNQLSLEEQAKIVT